MNIALALKSEIARVSRKELKTETQQIRKATTQYRTNIAALKRRVADLERLVGRLTKGTASKATAQQAEEEGGTKQRFSAKGFAAQRKRLGLTATDMAKLLGVSALSIYNWETGKTKPRASALFAIVALRSLGKKAVAAQLETLS